MRLTTVVMLESNPHCLLLCRDSCLTRRHNPLIGRVEKRLRKNGIVITNASFIPHNYIEVTTSTKAQSSVLLPVQRLAVTLTNVLKDDLWRCG